MANNQDNERFWSPRLLLALVVSSLVLVGILAFGTITIVMAEDPGTSAKDVLTATLPVLGTWVATVLAYYFNKENLDAAAKNVKEVLSMTLNDRLRSMLVKDKMIPKDKIIYGKLPADKIKLVDVLQEIDTKRRGLRYPIFDETGKFIKFIIHKSKIVEYLADLALQGAPQSDLQSKTLQDVLNDPKHKDYGELFQSSFGTVDESATLMDTKITMDAISNCQDIFVTKGGKRDDEVVGWITNAIIAENSKVQ